MTAATRLAGDDDGNSERVPWHRIARAAVVIAVLVVLAPSADAAGATTTRRALVVGVSDYSGRTSDTVGGAGDAEDVRVTLTRAGFRPENMRVLVDGQATGAAIRDGLRWLAESSNDATFSVFHYSGHVKQLGGDRDRDGEALDEFLWASDNAFISDGELASWLRRLRGRAWIDIAGCEAAGFDDGVSSPQRLFTASSTESEKSYEHPDWRNSIFVGLLVDQGMMQGRADADDNGRVSIQEAFALAARDAPHLTARQSHGPQHPVLHGGDGRHWYLDAEKPKPKPERCLLLCG